MLKLAISELFYSLQCEGKRTGEPSIFIRLQGCSAKYACYASGVKCDTEFESGAERTLEDIVANIRAIAPKCEWIVWTGGEPLDQLTAEHITFFTGQGYRQAIETSGLKPLPEGAALHWVTVSPKVAEHVLRKNFKDDEIDELKYIRHVGQEIPQPSVRARYYLVSPHFDGYTPNDLNVKHCIKLCLENPQWQLSIQSHKLLFIL